MANLNDRNLPMTLRVVHVHVSESDACFADCCGSEIVSCSSCTLSNATTCEASLEVDSPKNQSCCRTASRVVLPLPRPTLPLPVRHHLLIRQAAVAAAVAAAAVEAASAVNFASAAIPAAASMAAAAAGVSAAAAAAAAVAAAAAAVAAGPTARRWRRLPPRPPAAAAAAVARGLRRRRRPPVDDLHTQQGLRKGVSGNWRRIPWRPERSCACWLACLTIASSPARGAAKYSGCPPGAGWHSMQVLPHLQPAPPLQLQRVERVQATVCRRTLRTAPLESSSTSPLGFS